MINHLHNYLSRTIALLCLFVVFSCSQHTLPQEPDTIPPIGTIIYPVDGMTVSGIVNVRIAASDDDRVALVVYLINNVIQDSMKSKPYTYAWNTLQFEDDEEYFLSAKIIDRSDNIRQTEPITITVDNIDNQGPLGELLYPTPGLTVSETVQILAYPTGNDAIEAIFLIDDSLRFTDDSLEIKQPWNVNVFSYEWDTFDVTYNETHTITVVLSDTANNSTALSSWVFVSNQIDIIPPIGNITNPAAGQSVQGIVSIQVSATDNDGINYVTCFIDGDSLDTDSIYPYQFDWNTSDFTEDSEHMISVTITDLSGNVASAPPISVFINNIEDPDISPPSGTIISPIAGQTVNGIIPVEIIAYDDIEVSHVEFMINGSTLFIDESFPYIYDWNTENMPEDQESIIGASVYDAYGNWAPVQPISVFIDNHDNNFPEGVITSPYAGQIVQGIIDVQVLASDDVGVQCVEFYINGELVLTDEDSPYEYNWDTSVAEEDENHSITVIIEDVNGNRTTLTPISVFVNNLPAADTAPPIVNILNPLSGQTLSGTVQIQINATDNTEVESVAITLDGVIIHEMTESPYNYSWDTTPLENQSQHTIGAIASDINDNSSMAQPVLVIIDNE